MSLAIPTLPLAQSLALPGCYLDGVLQSRNATQASTGITRYNALGQPVDSNGQEDPSPAAQNILVQTSTYSRFASQCEVRQAHPTGVPIDDLQRACGNITTGFGYMSQFDGMAMFMRGAGYMVLSDGSFRRLSVDDYKKPLTFGMAVCKAKSTHNISTVSDHCISEGELKGKNWAYFLSWLKNNYITNPDQFHSITLTVNLNWFKAHYPHLQANKPELFKTMHEKKNNTLYLAGFYVPESADKRLFNPGFHIFGVKSVSMDSHNDGGMITDGEIGHVSFLNVAIIDHTVILPDSAQKRVVVSTTPPPHPCLSPASTLQAALPRPAPARRPRTTSQQTWPRKQKKNATQSQATPSSNVRSDFLPLLPETDQAKLLSNMCLTREAAMLLGMELSRWFISRERSRKLQIADFGSSALPLTVLDILESFHTSSLPGKSSQQFHYAFVSSDPKVIKQFRDFTAATRTPRLFPLTVREIRMMQGSAFDTTDTIRLKPDFLPKAIDILFTGLLLHHSSPEAVFNLAKTAHHIMDYGAVWLIHDLFMPEDFPYLTLFSEMRRDYKKAGLDFPFERVSRYESEDPAWRQDYLQELEKYLRTKGIPEKTITHILTHSKGKDYPYSMNMLTHILKQAGFRTSQIPFADYFKSHPLSPWFGAIVAHKE